MAKTIETVEKTRRSARRPSKTLLTVFLLSLPSVPLCASPSACVLLTGGRSYPSARACAPSLATVASVARVPADAPAFVVSCIMHLHLDGPMGIAPILQSIQRGQHGWRSDRTTIGAGFNPVPARK